MIDRRIKIRHLQCFVEINRHKSLKRAAERLYLTQPAISKTLKELEDIVDARLLVRSRAGVALTKQGEVFLHFAEMSLAALQQGVSGVEQLGKGGSAQLVIGALPSVAARLMPVVAQEFASLAQDTTLRIVDGPHGFLVDQLRAGALDLVIGRMGPTDQMQGVSFTQLYSERVDFVVRPGHPLIEKPDLHKIADWLVVYPSEGSAIRSLVEGFLIANGVGELPQRIETVSGAFGRVFVPNSDAVWVISSGVVAKEVADGRLVRLPFDTSVTKGPVGLMSRSEHEPTPGERVFRLTVQNAIAQLGL